MKTTQRVSGSLATSLVLRKVCDVTTYDRFYYFDTMLLTQRPFIMLIPAVDVLCRSCTA